eukprot:superscaffoldBa00010074_g24487
MLRKAEFCISFMASAHEGRGHGRSGSEEPQGDDEAESSSRHVSPTLSLDPRVPRRSSLLVIPTSPRHRPPSSLSSTRPYTTQTNLQLPFIPRQSTTSSLSSIRVQSTIHSPHQSSRQSK